MKQSSHFYNTKFWFLAFSFLSAIVVLLLALGIVFYGFYLPNGRGYYAVLLNSGDMYFGNVHGFYNLSLTDTYVLQYHPSVTTTPYSLAKFSDIFWGPQDKLLLNRKQIMWMAKLSDASEVRSFIEQHKLGAANTTTMPSPSDGVPGRIVSPTSSLPK